MGDLVAELGERRQTADDRGGVSDMHAQVVVRTEIFREGDVFVGVCPDLDVSSFGETVEEARQCLREALEAFIEECDALGTLREVLEEAGFSERDGSWFPRQPVSVELLPVA
jgi:predicted RNase H-like HicB family nuclease